MLQHILVHTLEQEVVQSTLMMCAALDQSLP